MGKEDLRATLEKLKSEVQGLSFRNERDRERMHAAIEALERLVRRTSENSDREQVLQSIKQLEAEHPTLTAVLSRVITALSSMGI